MKKVILIALLIAAAMGCKKEYTPEYVYTTTAKVIDGGNPAVDGCGWLLKIESNYVYADNLPSEYKINKQKVIITYTKLIEPYRCGFRGEVNYDQIHLKSIRNLTKEEDLIIKELPKMYPDTINFPLGRVMVINEEEYLYNLLSKKWVNASKDLKDIDFSTQTLILGYDSYPNLANFDFNFKKETEGKYIFTVEISGLATQPDEFVYGIVVKKLPKRSWVIKEVHRF